MSLTFDLSPEQVARQGRARDVATLVLAPAAATIDATGKVPTAVLDAIAALGIWEGTDPVGDGPDDRGTRKGQRFRGCARRA